MAQDRPETIRRRRESSSRRLAELSGPFRRSFARQRSQALREQERVTGICGVRIELQGFVVPGMNEERPNAGDVGGERAFFPSRVSVRSGRPRVCNGGSPSIHDRRPKSARCWRSGSPARNASESDRAAPSARERVKKSSDRTTLRDLCITGLVCRRIAFPRLYDAPELTGRA